MRVNRDQTIELPGDSRNDLIPLQLLNLRDAHQLVYSLKTNEPRTAQDRIIVCRPSRPAQSAGTILPFNFLKTSLENLLQQILKPKNSIKDDNGLKCTSEGEKLSTI